LTVSGENYLITLGGSVILSALEPPLPNEEEQGIAASELQEAA
jgi:hypothetical protein